jgi:hypothetical protein
MLQRLLPFLIGVCPFFRSVTLSAAVTFQEGFSSDPTAHGWRSYGDAALFQWNSSNQNLEITWDSAHPNSYYTWPLPTIVSRTDDFAFAFDLRLGDIAIGTTPDKPFTFELGIGLINLGEATAPGFLRGTGADSPDLVEFDYFPDSGFGATISPTIISSNVVFATGFNSPLELMANDWYHVAMSYTASNETLVTTMTRNGAPFDPIQNVQIGSNFTDFRTDHFAIASYSDAGQDPQFAGSLLAHGVVDNIVVTVPDVAVTGLIAERATGSWQVGLNSRIGWRYTLERTEDFQSWAGVSAAIPGLDGRLTLSDTNAQKEAFYRIKAERP